MACHTRTGVAGIATSGTVFMGARLVEQARRYRNQMLETSCAEAPA
jgi:hypothetical protein